LKIEMVLVPGITAGVRSLSIEDADLSR
jgi:hypothetical protein